MSTTVMNYTINPFVKLFNIIQHSLLIAGYAKAAAELSRQGYYEEAKTVMLELKKLRDSK